MGDSDAHRKLGANTWPCVPFFLPLSSFANVSINFRADWDREGGSQGSIDLRPLGRIICPGVGSSERLRNPSVRP